jgi:hypothetical protein
MNLAIKIHRFLPGVSRSILNIDINLKDIYTIYSSIINKTLFISINLKTFSILRMNYILFIQL